VCRSQSDSETDDSDDFAGTSMPHVNVTLLLCVFVTLLLRSPTDVKSDLPAQIDDSTPVAQVDGAEEAVAIEIVQSDADDSDHDDSILSDDGVVEAEAAEEVSEEDDM